MVSAGQCIGVVPVPCSYFCFTNF